jgi:hypothetical protein
LWLLGENIIVHICHYDNVDIQNIEEKFLDNKKHRCYLNILLKHRTGKNTICVIVQNPSNANKYMQIKHYIISNDIFTKSFQKYPI